MKKIILVVALFVVTFAVKAQQFNIGLGGGIYSTWLINSNVSDQAEDLDFSSTFGGQIGLNTQYYFKDNLAISMGLLFTGHNQKYTGILGTNGTNTLEDKIKLRYLDIPFLIRFGGGAKGAYFELGPQFSVLMGAKEDLSTSPSNTYFVNTTGGEIDIHDYSGKDVKSAYSSGGVAAIMGFGVDIDASENITVGTGLRLGYAFGDVTKSLGSDVATQTYALTGELAGDANAFSVPNFWANYNNKDVYTHKSTNRAFGGLFINIMYKIPVKGASKPAAK
jgi:hypothetical protein